MDITDAALGKLVSSLAGSTAWAECSNPAPGVPVVTDTVPAPGAAQPTVLVVAPTPFAAATALSAAREFDAGAVLCSDDLGGLGAALDAAADDTVTIQGRVVRLARRMPELTGRQLAVLVAVLAGRSNTEVAAELCVSTASVKRDLADLYRLCGVANRVGLAARGFELGLVRPPDIPARMGPR